MPNCSEAECINYVNAEGMFCRIHQDKSAPDIRVTYIGEGIVQLPYGNFAKGTTASIPKPAADELRGNKDWQVHS